ncbi:hypothetical protein GCM10010530_69580 [Kribbella aluminosa]
MVKYANTLKTRSGLSVKKPSPGPFAVTNNWMTIPHATTATVTAAQTRPPVVMLEMYDE